MKGRGKGSRLKKHFKQTSMEASTALFFVNVNEWGEFYIAMKCDTEVHSLLRKKTLVLNN